MRASEPRDARRAGGTAPAIDGDRIKRAICESIDVKRRLAEESIPAIRAAAQAIARALMHGGKLLIFGNGGSAADSQHIAAELVGRFRMERRPLPAISLTTNTSNLTALANDYGYEATFKRQVEALGQRGDAVLAVSTSGDAANVIEAVKTAKKIGGISTIGLTGRGGGRLAPLCDIAIIVPSADTARIQEAHITVGHIICDLVEVACVKERSRRKR